MGIALFKKEVNSNKDDSTSKSEIQCFADCYFNRRCKGECSCDLKTVIIDKTGRCQNFIDRLDGIKIFHTPVEINCEVKIEE